MLIKVPSIISAQYKYTIASVTQVLRAKRIPLPFIANLIFLMEMIKET
jgi:hypothetical protein